MFVKLFRIFYLFAKIRYFLIVFGDFAQILMKFHRNFANILENVEIF